MIDSPIICMNYYDTNEYNENDWEIWECAQQYSKRKSEQYICEYAEYQKINYCTWYHDLNSYYNKNILPFVSNIKDKDKFIRTYSSCLLIQHKRAITNMIKIYVETIKTKIFNILYYSKYDIFKIKQKKTTSHLLTLQSHFESILDYLSCSICEMNDKNMMEMSDVFLCTCRNKFLCIYCYEKMTNCPFCRKVD